jgi:hypothetical protein
MKVRSADGIRLPTSTSMPSANAVSVDVAAPDPRAEELPPFTSR